MTTKFDLEEHLAAEHKLSPFTEYMKEIVYGGVDGIITTFAVVAGFAGATGGDELSMALPVTVVLLFGLANLFADATSMALGNFLSVRADQDVYRSEQNKERAEIRKHPEMELLETVELLKKKGFTNKQSIKLADIFKKNESYWTEFMMMHELEMDNPTNSAPLYTAMATFFSFIVFGFVPLIPYVFFANNSSLFFLSITFTAFALFVLGSLRWKATTVSGIRSIGETVLLGGIAATIAYFVGTFFRV